MKIKLHLLFIDGHLSSVHTNKQDVVRAMETRGIPAMSYAGLCYQLRSDDRAATRIKPETGDLLDAEVWLLETGVDYGSYWKLGDKHRDRTVSSGAIKNEE